MSFPIGTLTNYVADCTKCLQMCNGQWEYCNGDCPNCYKRNLTVSSELEKEKK